MISVIDADGNVVCDDEPYYPKALDECNAPLISAAPCLLAALEAILQDCIDADTTCHLLGGIGEYEEPDSCIAARAAIAKARGAE